ncbi:MAG: hypothetical protein ACE5GJ_09190 [Gemmatimonadota bacterium]
MCGVFIQGCEDPFQAPAARSAIIYGVVTTSTGVPVVDARVQLQLDPLGCPATESQFNFVYPVTVITGADGSYRGEPTLEVEIEETCVWIRVLAPVGVSFSRGPVEARVLTEPPDSLEVNITLDIE